MAVAEQLLNWALLSALISVTCFGAAVSSGVSTSPEYQLKAAFLLNFPNFVEWPADAFTGPGDPLVFGVFGKDPFDGALNDAGSKSTIKGRHILIRFSSDPVVLRSCHVVFIPAGQMRGYTKLSSAIKASSVLTVGETAEFTERGGMITFLLQEGHLRFTVDQGAAEKCRLKVSSKLLQLAVRHPPEK